LGFFVFVYFLLIDNDDFDPLAAMEKEQETEEKAQVEKKEEQKGKEAKEDDVFAGLQEAKEEVIELKKETKPVVTVKATTNSKKKEEADKKAKFREKLRQKDLEASNTVNERGYGNQMLSAAQRQKIVEEADMKQATELFGVTGKSELDTFCPKSEQDFIAYAKLVAEKPLYFKNERNYSLLVKELVKLIIEPLNTNEVNDISKTVSAVYNEKLKKIKEKDKPKKKTNDKPMIAKDFNNYEDDEYDDYDDYDDFM